MYYKIKDNIGTADLKRDYYPSNIRSLKYLLCVIDVFIKCSWVETLTDKKFKTGLDGFIGLVNESWQKPNKWWVYQGRECHNNYYAQMVRRK